MIDGSPNDILKESLNIMLGSASRDENMESVMLESTVGPAIIEEVYSNSCIPDKHFSYLHVLKASNTLSVYTAM